MTPTTTARSFPGRADLDALPFRVHAVKVRDEYGTVYIARIKARTREFAREFARIHGATPLD